MGAATGPAAGTVGAGVKVGDGVVVGVPETVAPETGVTGTGTLGAAGTAGTTGTWATGVTGTGTFTSWNFGGGGGGVVSGTFFTSRYFWTAEQPRHRAVTKLISLECHYNN